MAAKCKLCGTIIVEQDKIRLGTYMLAHVLQKHGLEPRYKSLVEKLGLMAFDDFDINWNENQDGDGK